MCVCRNAEQISAADTVMLLLQQYVNMFTHLTVSARTACFNVESDLIKIHFYMNKHCFLKISQTDTQKIKTSVVNMIESFNSNTDRSHRLYSGQ